ncbi:hypothetical protein [Christiangramia aquimixticola]|uniref:hypothetical protein n=1 Tax=Christiangramia aquimixticola TaxID=1697558 RepID=UPI003AA9D0C9
MKLYSHIKNKLSLLFLPVALLSLVSCGSYQYSGYETDGIYSESRPGIWEENRTQPQTQEVKPNNENTYYKNLFAQQSQMYGELIEGDVFTDVDSYSSNNGYDDYSETGGDVAYVGGNAPWGNDPDTYTINIINNNRFGGYYSPWNYRWAYRYGNPYYAGFYAPFWDPFYSPYWGGRMAYGYGSPYWSFGFSFGYGRAYGYPHYYNPYAPYYYHHGYPYNTFRSNNIAYSRSRRNTTNYRDNDNRRSSYSRSIREIRNSQNTYGTSRVRSSVSDNEGNSRVYTRTNRRTEPTRTYDANSRSSSPVYQRSSESSNRAYRSTPSRRTNTGTNRSVRSSSSSNRSSSGNTTRSSSNRTSRGGRGGN